MINKTSKNRDRENFFTKVKKRYFSYSFVDKQFNMYLMIASLILSIIGTFILLSSSTYLTIIYSYNKYYYILKHSIFLFVGIYTMYISSKIDYRVYRKYAWLIYVICLILLLLCYVPGFYVSINGAKRWVRLLIVFMPSDVAKFGVLIALIRYITKDKYDKNNLFESVLKPAAIIGIPFILIFFQKDLSTSVLLAFSIGIIYLIDGTRKFYKPFIVVAVILLALILVRFLSPYQLDRLTAFMNVEAHSEDLSWQVLNGLYAISRGGLYGVGYGNSIYKQGYLAEEVNSDMIFSVFAEEFGFIGSVLLICFIFLIFFLIIREGMKAKDRFAKFVCYGIGAIYFIQSLANIGVALSILPNTGLPLPFISNGGTALVIFYFMIGVVLNISRKNRYDENELKKKIKEKVQV